MEEYAEEAISDKTMSDNDEYAEHDEEWIDPYNSDNPYNPDNPDNPDESIISGSVNPDESVSQISRLTSDIDETSGSAVWIYFDRNPSYAPGYNVCKKCSIRYKVTTSVTTLRNHLKKHQLKVPTKKQKTVVKKKEQPFDEAEREKHDNHLLQWLICDLQPFTVVDNEHFRNFLNFFCPHYDIPDRHKVK